MGGLMVLQDLQRAGFSLAADGDRLIVSPASKLTAELSVAIREHKDEIIRELQHPQPTSRCSRCGSCAYYRSEAGPWACLSCSDVPKAIPRGWFLTPDVPAARDV